MKQFILCISLLLAIQVNGQAQQSVISLLQKKDFPSFKLYIDSAFKKGIQASWVINRDIVSEYQEAVVEVAEKEPLKKKNYRTHHYTINLLATRTDIFYYKLTERIDTDDDIPGSMATDETTNHFIDEAKYTMFEKTFKDVYGVALDRRDIFLTSIVYGSSCGIAGEDPAYMQRLSTLIVEKNLTTIRSWLKSANTEKQLYAIAGYKALAKQNYHLTNEENNLIKLISNI
ncbi:MAG: hypothetical protein ABI480_17140, partial [Chitinophagaceae bacterium]